MEFEQALGIVTGRRPNKVQEHEEKINSILEDITRHDEDISGIHGDISDIRSITDNHSSRFEKLAEEKAEAEVAEDAAKEEKAEAEAAEDVAKEEKIEANEAEDEAKEEKSEVEEAEVKED